MQVVKIKHVEDCFDGSLIKELLLSEEISRNFIFAVGKDGDIQYFDNFARPFFKIRIHGRYDLKGIQGNRTMRIHIKNTEEYSLDDFIDFINGISQKT